jgi:hypothetical protein
MEPSGSVAFTAMGGVKNKSARRGDNDASDGRAHYEVNVSGSSTRCRLKKCLLVVTPKIPLCSTGEMMLKFSELGEESSRKLS